MNNQRGFTLFEFAITMTLSTMLMTAAFAIYNQVNKGAATVQRITGNDTQIMIVRDRLSTDFQGISPLWFTSEIYEKLKETEKTDAKGTTKPQVQNTKNKKNNFLYAQSNEKNLDFLTFVTTNPLQMYGDAVTRFVRVMYTLIPDPKNNNLYKLMRKEDKKPSDDIKIEKLKEGTFYELAHSITKLSIEFGYIKQPKKEDSDKKLSFIWTQKWNSKKENKENDSSKKDTQTPDLPQAIKIKVSFFHEAEKPAIDYEIFFMIPINQEQGLKTFAEKRAQTNQPKTPTGGQGPSGPGAANVTVANNRGPNNSGVITNAVNTSTSKIQPDSGGSYIIQVIPSDNKPGAKNA